MNIGEEIERITVEPLEDPVPPERQAPDRRDPERQPAREPVPAGLVGLLRPDSCVPVGGGNP